VDRDNILIIEVYVDDIIFISDDSKMSQNFVRDMKIEFEMSFLGELNFFSGLWYPSNKIFRYLKATKYFGLWYPKGNDLSFVSYKDADWAGSIEYKRSKSGAYLYLGEFLVSWLSKKQ
jgi:hypothetical protein